MNSQTTAVRPQTGGAQAIRRAVDTIKAVAQLQRSGATLSRIAHATGLSTSTSFRILRSMTEERLLRYDEDERLYFVGPLAFELGLAASGEDFIQPRWRRAVEEIAKATRLTTYLMIRADREAVCLMCVQGSMVLRAIPVDVGDRLPLGIGAGSLAILATLDDEEVHSVLASQDTRRMLLASTHGASEALLERVRLARERGFSMSAGTLARGVAGVGVAIHQPDGLAPLAISVSAVTTEFDPDEGRQLANIIYAAIDRHRS